MFKKISLLVSLLCITSCSEENSFFGKKEMEETIVPRKVLFGNPDKATVKISPDGKYISYVAPHDGVLNIHIAPTSEPDKAVVLTNEKGRPIRSYAWAYNNRNIVYMKDNGGDENYAIYSINIDTKESIMLTGKDAKSSILEISHKFPDEMLMSSNVRNKEYFDIYRVNVVTGKSDLVYQNDQFIAFDADNDFNLRFGLKKIKNNANELYEFIDAKNTRLFETIAPQDADSTAIVAFNKTNDSIYMFDSRDTNTTKLISVDLASKKKEVLFHNPKADISSIVLHPKEKTIQAVYSEYEMGKFHYKDEDLKSEFEYLQSKSPGKLLLTSRSEDDRHWIVAFENDDKPVGYYHYDRDQKALNFLFFNNAALEKYKLKKMEPLIIKSRDGLELVSYLTRSNKKVAPLILLVHGGPAARDNWGYNAQHQWLANRGYHVLSVNYRGSTGLGKAFYNAGNGEWAKKMHDDLIDAVNWAVDQGITARDKVAIMGASYGGYATLVGLTFTPDVFACGVNLVGVSNLVTFQESIPPYWRPVKDFLIQKTGGDAETEEGKKLLLSRSPITFADRISKPLLIGHGQNDPRVKKAESDQIVEKMKLHGIPVTYVVYPDEGHGFARPENKMSFWAITEQFLANNLGGKTEPVGKDLEGSSYQVLEGADSLTLAAKN